MLPVRTAVIFCVVCLVAGAVGVYLAALAFLERKKRKKRRYRSAKVEPEDLVQPALDKTEKKREKLGRPGVMNIILIVCAVTLIAFTVEMIELFKQYGMIPDTLVQCVFVAITGESGFMGWIKTNKEKYRDRRWRKEDERAANMAAQIPAVDPTEAPRE